MDLDQLEQPKMYYDSMIHDALKAGLYVSLFIGEQGELGVKIGDIELPYFAWETFEEQPGDCLQQCPERDEEIRRAHQVISLIADAIINKSKSERHPINTLLTKEEWMLLDDILGHVAYDDHEIKTMNSLRTKLEGVGSHH